MNYPIPNRVPMPTFRPANGGGMSGAFPPAPAAPAQPMAQAPMQAPQQGGGIRSWLGNNSEALAAMSQGLLSGRTADEQFAQGFGGFVEARAAGKKKTKTMEFLAQQDPMTAQAVELGLLTGPEAFKAIYDAKNKPTEYQQRAQAWKQYGGDPNSPEGRAYILAGKFGGGDGSKIINAGDGQLYNPDTNEWITAPSNQGGADFDTESKLRKEYNSLDNSQNYTKVRDAFERVRASAVRAGTDSTGASDMALVFSYMKMLDPGSTVREGEFAAAAQSGGYGPRIQNIVAGITQGKILTPQQRQEFVQTAQQLYNETLQNLDDTNDRYRSIAEANRVDPSRVLIMGEEYPPLNVGEERTVGDGTVTIKRKQ